MSSRQQRRAHERGQNPGGGGPRRRDPMVAVYTGLGVGILVVFLIFAFMNYRTKKAYEAALATPTPAATTLPKAIQLHDQTAVGKEALHLGDTDSGGQGAPVDGIECQPEMANYHVHAHLAVFVNGKQIAVPKFVGFAPKGAGGQGCLYWLHTHDASGILHVEAPHLQDFTLANFFHIWGMPLSSTQVATFNGPVTGYVNGNKYDGDFGAIPLTAHQQIVLEVGTPLVPPPNYAFPAGE